MKCVWKGVGKSNHSRVNLHDDRPNHYSDVLMGTMASQITGVWIKAKKKETSKSRVTGLCEGNPPMTGGFPSKRPVTRRMFQFDDVITQQQNCYYCEAYFKVCISILHVTGQMARSHWPFRWGFMIDEICKEALIVSPTNDLAPFSARSFSKRFNR